MTNSRFGLSSSFFAAACLLIIAPAAFAYHLFYLQSGASYVPTKWTTTPNFTVGSSTGATDITAEVTTAAASWKNITTAKSPLGTFTAVPAGTIYNGANFGTAWGSLTGDGKQEVVFDQDGSAFAALGLDPGSVNGYGPSHTTLSGGAAVINDAFLLLNGTRTNFDRQSTETHELGHIQGLAHSSVGMYNSASINGEFGAASPGGDVLDPINVLNVPTMHPFSTNTGTSRRTPKPDDAAALSELYPAATFTTTLGSISGTVTRCSDGTAVTGVNVRVVNTANTNIQLSRFTGYDGNTTGSYVINGIPPGTYRVLIEGLGANGFTIDRFTTNVPVKAENDFPTQYYMTTCGSDFNGTPPGTPPNTSGATTVSSTAGGSAGGTNLKVGDVDLAFVIDNTGSMYNEIAAVRTALAQFISDTEAATAAAGKPFPTVAVVPFVDTPSVQIISNNPTKLQAVVAAQFASGGGDCPEPSNNAVLTAGRLLKKKGVAMLFTDADSDYDGPSQATVDAYYLSKELRLSVLLSGSCTGSGFASSSVTGLAAPVSGGGSLNEEYQPDPPLGPVSSIATFSVESITSGGIFTVNTDIKSGISTGYINTAANIADSSVVPAVGLVSPVSGFQGATMTVTITGSNTNFTAASTIAFSGGGITVNSTSTLSATSITANITIDPASTLSFRDVTVTTNLGGGSIETAKGTGSFQVEAPPSSATLTGATPATGGEGQTVNVQISAIKSHFVAGTSTANFGAGVTVNSLTVANSAAATANVTIDPAAGIGFRHVSVTTGAEIAGDTGHGAFFVTAPAPLIAIIKSVAPNTGLQAQSGLGLTITGQNTHFASGTTVLSFSNSGITVTNLTINSATSASATINIATTASLGFSDVLMTTGGEGAALLSGFQVLPKPIDTTPPVINPQITGTVGNNGWYRSSVTVSWNVTDPESGIASSTGCTPTTLTADTAGATLTCSATNGAGLSASVSVTIKIDQTPPVISGMPAAGACSLWPPNGKMVQVATVNATDALSGLVPNSFQVTGSSNEPPSAPEISITPNGSGGYVIQLQADRLGTGSGRVYTLTATAIDLAGNSSSVTATCTVPHDRGN